MRESDLADPEALLRIAEGLPTPRHERPLSPPRLRALCVTLAGQLADRRWQPEVAERFFIPRSGGRPPRPLARLALPDRIVHRALHRMLERAHRGFPPGAMAYVRGGGALRLVQWLERRLSRGGAYAWSLDVVDYFPSVAHDRLERLLQPLVPPNVCRLVMRAVRTPVRDRAGVEHPTRGILQGSPLSPWLSNLYLAEVDTRFGRRGYRRFSDNVFFVGAVDDVRRAMVEAVAALARLGLSVRLKPCEPATADEGIECLGHHIDRDGRRPTRQARRRLLSRLGRRIERRTASSARALIRGHRAYFGRDPTGRLMTIDDLLRAGRFREALEALREAESVDDEPERGLSLRPEESRRLLRVVGGDPERHARLDGRTRTVVVRGVSPDDFAAHRRGEVELAALPVDRTGWAHVAAFDLDPLEPGGDVPVSEGEAVALAGAARARGLTALVERTGGRGHHVWLGLDRPVPVGEAGDLLDGLDRDVPGSPGVRRERFPSAPDRDPHLTLPLGVHRSTGAASTLLDASGTPIGSGAGLRAALRPPGPATEAPRVRSAAVQRVLRGCSLLGRLAQKARDVRHLGHHERYSLAAVLGHLPGGHEAVHGIIGWCDNYDAGVTQHFLDRLSRQPMGCERLAERHPEFAAACRCPRAGGGLRYASPVRLAALDRQPVERVAPRADDVERLIGGLQRTLARMKRG